MEEYKRLRRETVILLAIFLLPAIYTSAGQIDPSLFERPSAHLGLLIQNVPRILLLLYLMELDGGGWVERFGLSWVPGKLPFQALGVAAALLGISVVTNVVSRAFGLGGEPPFDFSSPSTLAYILSGVSLLSVGYMEELFFRSYLITRLRQLGLSAAASIVMGAFLFSLGHVYQGLQGVLFSLFAGLTLGYIFHRTGRIHALAIGHGGYNYLGLLFSGLQ